MANSGRITQVIGPVVDVAFDEPGTKLPNILDSLEVTKETAPLWCSNVSSTSVRIVCVPLPWMEPKVWFAV
jgi:F0F1-type ATP synthase beta subunit